MTAHLAANFRDFVAPGVTGDAPIPHAVYLRDIQLKVADSGYLSVREYLVDIDMLVAAVRAHFTLETGHGRSMVQRVGQLQDTALVLCMGLDRSVALACEVVAHRLRTQPGGYIPWPSLLFVPDPAAMHLPPPHPTQCAPGDKAGKSGKGGKGDVSGKGGVAAAQAQAGKSAGKEEGSGAKENGKEMGKEGKGKNPFKAAAPLPVVTPAPVEQESKKDKKHKKDKQSSEVKADAPSDEPATPSPSVLELLRANSHWAAVQEACAELGSRRNVDQLEAAWARLQLVSGGTVKEACRSAAKALLIKSKKANKENKTE